MMVCIPFLVNLHIFGYRYKFHTTEDISVKDLKLSPIIDQTGTYRYGASKLGVEFL